MIIPLSSPDLSNRETELVLNVLRGPALSMGPMVQQFERMVAEFVGARYAVAVNSGTSALHLAVRALNIGKGDEVITTPFSFVASSNCLLFEQAVPVFVDIDPMTLNINPGLIENYITKRTKAILPVHVFGHPADMKKILKISQIYNLPVIEDACEALGACCHGRMAGSESDISVFAFYPNKQITTGEGGMVLTGSENIAGLCRSMRNQGRDPGGVWLEHQRLGYNYRMSELNAALGVAQMERISELLDKRRAVASAYGARLSRLPGVKIPYVAPDVKMSWFVYVIRLSPEINRNRVMYSLQERGIDCRPYFTPIHLQPFYRKKFGYHEGDYPVCEREAASTLALPFFSNLTLSQIDHIVEELAYVLK